MCTKDLPILGSPNAQNAKSSVPVYFLATFSHFSDPRYLIDDHALRGEPKWRKSALLAQKCIFAPPGHPGGRIFLDQVHYLWPRAPLGPILAKRCTFRTLGSPGARAFPKPAPGPRCRGWPSAPGGPGLRPFPKCALCPGRARGGGRSLNARSAPGGRGAEAVP